MLIAYIFNEIEKLTKGEVDQFSFWEARINIVESKINVAHKCMVYIGIDSALEVA